jgi:hypothetical protein
MPSAGDGADRVRRHDARTELAEVFTDDPEGIHLAQTLGQIVAQANRLPERMRTAQRGHGTRTPHALNVAPHEVSFSKNFSIADTKYAAHHRTDAADRSGPVTGA